MTGPDKKRRDPGEVGIEDGLPGRLEVNRIHQRQPHLARLQHARLQQIGDHAIGLIRHPVVDLSRDLRGLGREIHLLEVGVVIGAGIVQESRQEQKIGLRPQPVRHA